MQPFSTPWKYQKIVRFSDVLRGIEKGCIGNEWIKEKNTVRKVSVKIKYNANKNLIHNM